jgi:hypothetical protein
MDMRTLAATVGDHHFVFRYAPGQEDLVTDEVMRLADDLEAEFGWLDAVRLCLQAAQGAAADGQSVASPLHQYRY